MTDFCNRDSVFTARYELIILNIFWVNFVFKGLNKLFVCKPLEMVSRQNLLSLLFIHKT
jgi:hypothetical protein